jgi:hypothetical protein
MWWLSHVVEGWMFAGRQGIHRSCTLWLMCVPWQQCHEEETDVYWEVQKDGNQFFTMLHLFSSSCYLERGMSAMLHESARWHIVLSTSDDVALSISWADNLTQPYLRYTRRPPRYGSVKGRAFNWLQVQQYSHHLPNCWTDWHLSTVLSHSHSYTKDYHSVQSYVFLRPNHCTSLHFI